jgi:hypothetical protein
MIPDTPIRPRIAARGRAYRLMAVLAIPSALGRSDGSRGAFIALRGASGNRGNSGRSPISPRVPHHASNALSRSIARLCQGATYGATRHGGMTVVARPQQRAGPPGSDGCPRRRRKGRTNPDSGLRPGILRFGPAAWRMCRAHPNETRGFLHHAAGERRKMPAARRAATLPTRAADSGEVRPFLLSPPVAASQATGPRSPNGETLPPAGTSVWDIWMLIIRAC